MVRICLLAGIVCAFFGAPARADFGDCSKPDYLGGFGGPDAASDPSSPVRRITCVVEFEFEHTTPGGPRRIRGIRDVSADWAFRPGALAEVEVGARAAAAAMPSLGDYRVDDITIMILDDGYERMSEPRSPDGTVGAVTSGDTSDNECRVTSIMFGRAGRTDEVAQIVAHEIFHCVQAASLSAAQWNTTRRGGAWWAEGSAEYFASLAVPASGDLHGRVAAFDADVAAKKPLYDQSYGMAVLFYWLHGLSGPSELLPFLRQMASSSGDGAQRAAMRAALSDDKWLDFAQAYADRSITHPNGSALAFSGDDGDNIRFERNRTERTRLRSFVLRRGWVNYACGRWENRLSPDDTNIGARPESGSSWDRYPPEIDAREGREPRHRFAALHTRDGAQTLAIEAEKRHSCEPCAGSEELDACVVGIWVMSGGGPIEWMKRMGVPIVRDDPGTRIVRFGEDGTYFTQPFGAQITVELDDKTAEGVGQALPAAGRWSIAGGRLAICQDSGGMSGVVRMDGITMPVAQAGGGTLLNGYSCSETSLETSLDVGAGSPMTTSYNRIGGPPASE